MIGDQLSASLFTPLVVAGILFLVAQLSAAFVRARGQSETADRILDIGFAVALLAAVWSVVLALIAVFAEPSEVWDMVSILLVISAFFTLLVLGLFLLFEFLPRRLGRRASKQSE